MLAARAAPRPPDAPVSQHCAAWNSFLKASPAWQVLHAEGGWQVHSALVLRGAPGRAQHARDQPRRHRAAAAGPGQAPGGRAAALDRPPPAERDLRWRHGLPGEGMHCVTAWVSCCLLARLNVHLRCLRRGLPSMGRMLLLPCSTLMAVHVCRRATTPSRGMGSEGRGRRTISFLRRRMGAARLPIVPCRILHRLCQSSVPL